MTEKNWAIAENGAKVVEVSHEATYVASAAANLLVEREDLLWITADAPQHVTLQISETHPPLQYVGWHVWHDYLTNPKTVEVSSGGSVDDMAALLVCQALTGAGTQIWKLPNPIPPNHRFIRIKILETFGPGPTYLNNVVLFANDPGPCYRSTRAGMNAGGSALARSAKEGTNGRMSELLKELDEDIRALHPLKAVTPKKNMLLYVPQEPVAILPPMDAEDMKNGKNNGDAVSPPIRGLGGLQGKSSMNSMPPFGSVHDFSESRLHNHSHLHHHSQQQHQLQHPFPELPRSFGDRLGALEQAVASLTQTMIHQREDLTMIKRLLLQQATDRRHEIERQLAVAQSSITTDQQQQQQQQQVRPHRVSRHQVAVNFPEDALRTFVEGVVSPKLHKHAKRTEAQTLAKIDDFLKDVVTEMTHAVDERVRLHVQQLVAGDPAAYTKVSPKFPSRVAGTSERSRASYERAAYYQSRPAACGTPCSGYGNDGGSVPMSIIRDTSTEIDPMYSRRSRASTR